MFKFISLYKNNINLLVFTFAFDLFSILLIFFHFNVMSSPFNVFFYFLARVMFAWLPSNNSRISRARLRGCVPQTNETSLSNGRLTLHPSPPFVCAHAGVIIVSFGCGCGTRATRFHILPTTPWEIFLRKHLQMATGVSSVHDESFSFSFNNHFLGYYLKIL